MNPIIRLAAALVLCAGFPFSSSLACAQGSLKQQLIAQLLKDWAGPTGWVWKIRFQFRAMSLVGERLDIWARVAKTERLLEFGLVDLALGIRNEAGVESTPGSATVALPFRGGKMLPYPFIPPTG